MLLIHLADIHLRKGSSKYKVYEDVIDNLFRKVDEVQGEKMFVICGDIIHDRNTLDAFVVQLFSKFMRGLASRGDVIMIQGNHDHHPSHADAEAPYDILSALVSALDLKNVHYIDKTGGTTINGVYFATVTIHDANEDGDVRSNAVKKDLPAFPVAEAGASHKVALWHGGISSCRYGNMSVKSKGVSLKWFEGYDIALLGDIHLQQIGNHVVKVDANDRHVMAFSDTDTTWGYPGSLLQQDHGEQLWDHGFLVWDLTNRTIEPIHVPCPEGYLTIKGSDVYHNQGWSSLEKHLQDPEFPTQVRIRSVGTSDDADGAKLALELLNARNVQIQSLSGLNVRKAQAKAVAVVDGDYVQEGGCTVLLEKRGIIVEEVIANSILPKFANTVLDKLREDRYVKQEKLLSKFRDVKGINDNVLSLGKLNWSWILSFRDGNETRAFSDEGLTVLHAPNGTGKTALLETLYLALYGEGFPSRTIKDDSASFINDDKPSGDLASTELVFGIGQSTFIITRKWNKQGDKAVVKDVSLRMINAGDKEVILHKGRVEVDKWITANVCTGSDFLAGIMMTQGNDSDFLTMTSREQCAMINRAFGLDSLDALYDYLHETKNSMNYLLNQVPDDIAEASDEDTSAMKHELAQALDREATIKSSIERLATPLKKAIPTRQEYETAIEYLAKTEPVEEEYTSAAIDKIKVKLDTISRIVLPVGDCTEAPMFKGSFGEAKAVVEAQVRLEGTLKKYGWSLEDLTATKEYDLKAMIGASSSTEDKKALASNKREIASLKKSHTSMTKRITILDETITKYKRDLRETMEFEMNAVSRVLSRKAEEIDSLWTRSEPDARAGLMLDYIMATAPDLLPTSDVLIDEGFTPKASFWTQDFKTCASMLSMKVPDNVTASTFRPGPPSSELVASLNVETQNRTDAVIEMDKINLSLKDATSIGKDLEDRVTTHDHRVSEAERCKKRIEALSIIQSCVDEIGKRSSMAAKAKFVREKDRLTDTLATLESDLDAVRLVQYFETESKRSELKKELEALDLLGKSKRVGIAETRRVWSEDVPIVQEYKRRLGHILQALAMLKDIKDNVYGEYVLPELCKRVNRAIATVDHTIQVHATMDNSVVKWYCIVSGSRIRIKRASGFQQFIIAMGIRVELGSMIRPCRTILIDEGFTACDADHIMKIPTFLESLISVGKFSTVLIVTHIESLQNGVSNTISMKKGERMCM